ncbi:MAG: hypothetical protein WC238_05805 [Parcubacteria group bacterium]|jgi:hypothetical protein
MKKITKKDREIMEKWRKKEGGCYFDFQNKNIILPDGSLFGIEKKKYKAHKIIGYKKLQNKSVQVLFSKKKIIPSEKYEATIWMSELDEMIRYFKSMKKMLNNLGIKTKLSLRKPISQIQHSPNS